MSTNWRASARRPATACQQHRASVSTITDMTGMLHYSLQNTSELNVTQWLTVRRSSAVVQGHMPVHPWEIWLKWCRYEWSLVIRSLPPRCWHSNQGHFPDDFRTAAYDHVRSSPFLADIRTSWMLIWGCVLYIGLQIFTLWQKSKVGARIIFDGVLYSKFYGKYLCSTFQE